jgi:hypothetical protein
MARALLASAALVWGCARKSATLSLREITGIPS